MAKVDLGFAASDALDHFMNRYKDVTAKEISDKLGTSASTVGRWRNNPFAKVEPEKIGLIKKICAETWPSPEKIADMENDWDGRFISESRGCYSKARKDCVSLDDDDYWEKQGQADPDTEQRQWEEARRKKKLYQKQVVLLEKKYQLPALKGKFAQSIRYNLIVVLSKDLSMHVPEIIAKYPQCKEIIFNADESFWWNNEKKSIVAMAKIPQEDLKRNERFNVFTKNEQQALAGCSTIIIVISLLILVIFGY